MIDECIGRLGYIIIIVIVIFVVLKFPIYSSILKDISSINKLITERTNSIVCNFYFFEKKLALKR